MNTFPNLILLSLSFLFASGLLVSAQVQATASAWEQKSHGGFGDFPPANTVDGIISADSSWRGEGAGVWIQYDLGKVLEIQSIQIAFLKGDTRSYVFDIMASEAGQVESWKTVAEGVRSSGTTIDLENFSLGGVLARYIRLVGRGNTSEKFPDWFNITETIFITR